VPVYVFVARLHADECCLTRRHTAQVISIDALLDEVLLETFDFFVGECQESEETQKEVEAWQSLVHVCHR
jgi:hypothetical protein